MSSLCPALKAMGFEALIFEGYIETKNYHSFPLEMVRAEAY
jgi:hypothetical protein